MIHRSMSMISKFRERTSAYIVCCLAATSALPGVVFAQQDAFAVPYQDEQRASLSYTDFGVAAPPAIPHTVVTSDTEAFVVELFADGLDRLPYSIAPLPDGRVLVTEKTRGLPLFRRRARYQH